MIFKGIKEDFVNLIDILNIYLKLCSVELVLLDSLISLKEEVIVLCLNCYNCMCVIMLSVNLVDGYILEEVFNFLN